MREAEGLPVVLVAAVAKNGVIGASGDMPWYLPTDFKFFKETTMGCPMIMGRRTFEAIGKPLPGRLSLVVSRNPGFCADGITKKANVADALEEAKSWAKDHGSPRICVIGGGEIYRQTMDMADGLIVTEVMMEPDGDTFFPQIDDHIWEAQESQYVPAGPKDSADMRFITYARR